MSYTIKYTGPRTEMLAKAYGDALQFNTQGTVILGKEFRRLWLAAADLNTKKQVVRCMYAAASFAGISGFPVRAIMRHALTQSDWRMLT